MHKYAISGGITWIMEQTGELTGRYTQIWDLYGIYMGFMIQNRDLPWGKHTAKRTNHGISRSENDLNKW